jgi:hypothetical protein
MISLNDYSLTTRGLEHIPHISSHVVTRLSPPPIIHPFPTANLAQEWLQYSPHEQDMMVLSSQRWESSSWLPVNGAVDNRSVLLDVLCGHMESAKVNPHKGNVPLDSLQQLMEETPEDKWRWSAIIGTSRTRLVDFICNYPSVFQLTRRMDWKWQVRLCAHTNWQMGDRCKQNLRKVTENHWINCLTSHLLTQPAFTDTVTRFMGVYGVLPINQQFGSEPPTLPPRGNLIRLIRRYKKKFIYDDIERTVRLL